MKLSIILLALLGLGAFGVSQFLGRETCTNKTMAKVSFPVTDSVVKGFALVELFTSEGCSSCPPADALLEKLAAENIPNIYLLSYHVDYWDKLGWKDAFSKPDWTARQATYIEKFHLESAYTPQAVVNGREEFVGSSNLQLHASIDNALHGSNGQDLRIKASKDDEKIEVSYETSSSSTNIINLVLVQLAATSQVARGENRGRLLHHVNVVSDLRTVDAKSNGDASFKLPDGFSEGKYKIIAFVQNKKNLEIVGATEADIK